MKILVSHDFEKNSLLSTDGEMVMFSLYQKHEDNSMIGITSGLFTHFVKVEELNIDRGLICEIIKNAVEERYKAKFKGESQFEVMSYFRYENPIFSQFTESRIYPFCENMIFNYFTTCIFILYQCIFNI